MGQLSLEYVDTAAGANINTPVTGHIKGFRDNAVSGSGTYYVKLSDGTLELLGGPGLLPPAGTENYVATLTQSGTAAPVATVLENNLGAIVWARTGIGNYTGTLTGAFTANRTYLIIANLASGNDQIVAVRQSTNTILINTSTVNFGGSSFDAADGILNETTIEIRVYP